MDRLIVAVEEALRLGVSNAAAVSQLLRMPDPEERRRHGWRLNVKSATGTRSITGFAMRRCRD